MKQNSSGSRKEKKRGTQRGLEATSRGRLSSKKRTKSERGSYNKNNEGLGGEMIQKNLMKDIGGVYKMTAKVCKGGRDHHLL